jgi:hypothetical protein
MASKPECAAKAAGDSVTAGGWGGSDDEASEVPGAAEPEEDDAGASDAGASVLAPAAVAALENARTCMTAPLELIKRLLCMPILCWCCGIMGTGTDIAAAKGLLTAALVAVMAIDALHEHEDGVAAAAYRPQGQRPIDVKTDADADADTDEDDNEGAEGADAAALTEHALALTEVRAPVLPAAPPVALCVTGTSPAPAPRGRSNPTLRRAWKAAATLGDNNATAASVTPVVAVLTAAPEAEEDATAAALA